MNGKGCLVLCVNKLNAFYQSFYNVDRGVTMGGKEGTIPRAPNHYMGVEKLRECRKISTILQVVSSVQYICFRKTSWFEQRAPNFLLVPGTI